MLEEFAITKGVRAGDVEGSCVNLKMLFDSKFVES
jgi:hypothetical protein